MIVPSNVWFKEGFEEELLKEYQLIHPKLQIIAEDMAKYFHSNSEKFIITDILSEASEDKLLKRVSTSHSEGRAFDFRTRGIKKVFLDGVEKRFENLYKQYAAISKATGKPNLIYYHDSGSGPHAHVQIRRGV